MAKKTSSELTITDTYRVGALHKVTVVLQDQFDLSIAEGALLWCTSVPIDY